MTFYPEDGTLIKQNPHKIRKTFPKTISRINLNHILTGSHLVNNFSMSSSLIVDRIR